MWPLWGSCPEPNLKEAWIFHSPSGRSTMPQKGSFRRFPVTVLCAQMCYFMTFKSQPFEVTDLCHILFVHPPVSRLHGAEGQECQWSLCWPEEWGGRVCNA